MRNATVPYQLGYDYGIGVDSASGDRMQQGAQGTPEKVDGAGGGSGGFLMTRIQSTSDLEDQLGISADASGGVGLFSASGRFKFSRDCKVQSQSIVLMLTCTQVNGFMQINQPTLNSAAASLVGNGSGDLFTERYGDCFVAGLLSGGQFFGVIRIDVRSESDLQTIDAALSGSYGSFSADVATNVKNAMTQTQSHAETFLYYEGGNVQKKPQTPEDLFAAADEWSKSVLQMPKPYTALLMPWIIANGPNPPNAADLDHQKDVIKECAKLRALITDRLNVLEYILDPAHTNEFEMSPSDASRLAQLHAAVSDDLDVVGRAASFAIDNPKAAVEPETYARTVLGRATYAITVLPPDLPKRKDASTIQVPDFSKAVTNNDLNSLASANRLTFHYVMAAPQPTYSFMQQDPAPGTPVAPGTTVTVIGRGQPVIQINVHDFPNILKVLAVH